MMAALPERDYRALPGSYGDQLVAARYCGLATPPHAIPGEWQHGWIGPERNIHPEFVVGSDGKSQERRARARFLVARQDQADYLGSLGYRHVQAIGLPIVYLAQPALERTPGSLLVMPAHSLPETREEWDADAYAAYVRSIAPRFAEVCLCVHKSCAQKGNWRSAFEVLGIRIVEGAEERDHNSLQRMAALFSQFEFVTSNAYGSHLVYASYFGCKASVAGPRPRWTRRQFEHVPFYRNAPAVLDIIEEWNRSDRWNALYPQLRREPWEALPLRDWAAWQLGEQHKRAPHELRRLFGWDARGRALRVARGTVSPRRWLRYVRSARPLVATLGLPGLVAAFQLGRAARKTTGLSPVWCGWTKRLALRNGSTDLDVFQQHFARRELLAIRFEKEASTIVDLGANVGVSVQALRRRFPRARIVALERDRERAALCRANHASDQRVSVLTGALWSEPGPVRAIDVGDGARAFRAVPAAADDPRSVPAFTYRQILEMHRLRTIDVLKMNIEGAEADVLESAWEDIFGTAAVSIIEVHDWIDGIEERVRAAIERARKRFDLDVSRSGEFWVVRNRALGTA